MTNPNPVTFLHLRASDPPRDLTEQLFGTPMSSFGGMTLALREVDGGLQYAIARCNAGKIKNGKRIGAERYVKKEGRSRSLARLLAPVDDADANAYRRFIPGINVDQFRDLLDRQGATLQQLLAAEVVTN